MRRGREVGLVPGPPRRVVPDPPRGEVGAERAREVAGADVVGGDDERRPRGETVVGVEQRGEQERPDRGGCAQLDRLAGPKRGREGCDSLVVERYVEQLPEQFSTRSYESANSGPAARVADGPMPGEEELLDEGAAIEALNAALRLQYRSALQYSLTSSSLTGIPAQSIAGLLIGYGDEELADARALIEKIVSFGGEATTEIAELRSPGRARAGARLADRDRGRGDRGAPAGDRAHRPRGAVGGARAHARAHDHAQAAPGRPAAAGAHASAERPSPTTRLRP